MCVMVFTLRNQSGELLYMDMCNEGVDAPIARLEAAQTMIRISFVGGFP